jgi:DNA polymerase-3 subunit epsilon
MTQPYYEGPLLSLDTETTGTDPFTCSIVTCNMTYDIPGEEPKIYDWLINPGVGIPEGASAVHGVTDEIAQQHGMDPIIGLTNIAEHLIAWSKYDLPIVVYNAPYDLTLLLAEFTRYSIEFDCDFNRVIDPLVLDKALDKYRKGKRQLALVAEHYGVVLNNAHSADADSMASVQIARAIGKKYKLNMPVEEIHEKQKEFKKEQSESLQAYFRKSKNDPSIIINSDWPVQLTREGD